jgi:hypothetical protein
VLHGVHELHIKLTVMIQDSPVLTRQVREMMKDFMHFKDGHEFWAGMPIKNMAFPSFAQ